jgi:cupin domain
VEPGSKLWPYHAHHANEEWVIVLRGEPTLRMPDGEHVLTEGDVVAFPRGKAGAHQIMNRTDSPVRVLMLSSMVGPDVVDYIDSGKVCATDLAYCQRGGCRPEVRRVLISWRSSRLDLRALLVVHRDSTARLDGAAASGSQQKPRGLFVQVAHRLHPDGQTDPGPQTSVEPPAAPTPSREQSRCCRIT